MAGLPFFFHEAVLVPGEVIALGEETTRHIVQVLRKQEGDRIMLNNGRGQCAETVITLAEKKKCSVRTEKVDDMPAPAFGLHLCVAFTKNAARNEWILEKATELGAGSITPIISARMEREKFREDRARNILISALLQSQQYFLPVLNSPLSLADIVRQYEAVPQKLLAHCDHNFDREPIEKILQRHTDTLILIGPEGDFAPEEITTLLQSGFRGISLCTQRLRTETAAIAVCSYFNLLNHE